MNLALVSRRWLSRGAACGLVLFSAVFQQGCVTQALARRIVQAPNRSGSNGLGFVRDVKARAAADASIGQMFDVQVGPPAAALWVGVIEPADFAFTSSIKITPSTAQKEGSAQINLNWNYDRARQSAARMPAPKATVVLLHGILMSHYAMLPWAYYLAGQGYRVVLVDLRGHGNSTGSWIGFGAWEPADLMKVADELERRGLVAGKLGVLGQSYGGAMALAWAGCDPRVATVVALAPFSDARAAIPRFVREFNPKLAAGISDATFAAAEAKAASLAGFDWKTGNIAEALKGAHAPVLLLHGSGDTWVPPRTTEELLTAAPSGSRREVLVGDNHLSLMMRFDLAGPPTIAWLAEHLGVEAAR